MLKGRVELARLLDAAAGVLYPHAANCLCCGHPRLASETDSLCPDCRKKLTQLLVPAAACERCLSPVVQGKPCKFCRSGVMTDITAVYAPYRYQDEVRKLVHMFKFFRCDDAGHVLANKMADALKVRYFDCLTPVPMSPQRMRDQGANHAEILARFLAEETGIPVRMLLSRRYARRKQSTLQGAERSKNVENAFQIAEKAKGLRVLLVDDVRTTGSTAAACAKVLTAHGAESVSLCTAAVVYSRHPGDKIKKNENIHGLFKIHS